MGTIEKVRFKASLAIVVYNNKKGFYPCLSPCTAIKTQEHSFTSFQHVEFGRIQVDSMAVARNLCAGGQARGAPVTPVSREVWGHAPPENFEI